MIDVILRSRPHPEQRFRSAIGILGLVKRYGHERVDAACARALLLNAYALLQFYAATLLLRSAIVRLDASGAVRASLDRLVARIMRNPLAPVILAIPIGIAFSLDQKWIDIMGVRTPDQSLVTNLQALMGFGTAFGFGWLLHRQLDLLRIIERRWLWNLLLALGLILISFGLAGAMLPRPGAPSLPLRTDTLRLVSAVLYAFDVHCHRPRAPVHVRLQSDAPLHRRCVLLALSDPHANRDGAATRRVTTGLAVAGQVLNHSRGRLP